MSRSNPAKPSQKNRELALWKLSGNHPAIERAKELFPTVDMILLYEKGRTPRRRTIEEGRRWRYQLLSDGTWADAEQTHHRQPLNGKRPVLIGWDRESAKTTKYALFIWNL